MGQTNTSAQMESNCVLSFGFPMLRDERHGLAWSWGEIPCTSQVVHVALKVEMQICIQYLSLSNHHSQEWQFASSMVKLEDGCLLFKVDRNGLSPSWDVFKSECEHLMEMFQNLKYPERLIIFASTYEGLSLRAVTCNTCYSWVCLIGPWCYGRNCLLLMQFTHKVKSLLRVWRS